MKMMMAMRMGPSMVVVPEYETKVMGTVISIWLDLFAGTNFFFALDLFSLSLLFSISFPFCFFYLS